VSQKLTTDWILFSTISAMVALGLVMVYSSSSMTAQTLHNREPWYFVAVQLLWAVISFGAMMLMKRFNYKKLNHPGWAFSLIGVVMFLLPLAYVLDPRRHRWIPLGVGSLQPSEFAKPALAIFLAYFLVRRMNAINNAKFTLRPAAVMLGVLFFMVAVADLGTAIVLGVTAMTMFFVAGLDRRYMFAAAGIAALGISVAIVSTPYRLRRVVEAIDPTLQVLDKVDPTGTLKAHVLSAPTVSDTGYQARQARIAIGSGGLFGLGLMHGRQKHFYLPEPHTDFIYAVIGEELGLWGTTGVLFGFFVVMWRGIRLTLVGQNEFARFLALGLTVTIGFQALFNMTVVLGLTPTKGIPLPMISYGGSSLLSTLASLGILLNISEHAD
jgi:cell division protein FtsW